MLPSGTRVTMLAEWCGDTLSDFLSALRVQRTYWGRIELRAPAGVRFSAIPSVRCHLVVKGEAFLNVADATRPIFLKRGDFVMLPRGSGFTLQDAPDSPICLADPVRDIAIRLGRIPLIECGEERGGDGERAVLMVGRFELDAIAANFLQTLPDVIHIPAEAGALPA